MPPLEFYVDFETVSNLDDDFTKTPEQGGQTLIFMIGCGHVEGGAWKFESFCTDALTESAEEVIIDAWLARMAAAATRLAVDGKAPRVIHWSYAEPVNYEDAYNSARERHPLRGWPRVPWLDLWSRVVRDEPVVVRGALNFSLKSFARALHGHGLIETSWGDRQVDGLGAMVGAWWCAAEAGRRGAPMIDLPLMQDIAVYNQVDCKVMMEILAYLRAHY